MTGAEILALQSGHYARLFPDQHDLQRAYRALVKLWHPDRNREPHARDVFERIAALHGEACRARDDGTWSLPNVLRAVNGKRELEFSYRSKVAAPAGEIFIGRKHFMVAAGAGMDDLVEHATRVMAALPPPPAGLKAGLDRLLPQIEKGTAPRDRRGYAVQLPAGAIRLRDLLNIKGELGPKHVAWVVSGAYNLACYLDFAGVTHLGFDADHVFITPETHEVALLAGWEFAALRHEKPKAASPIAGAVLGAALKADPTDRRHHLQLIRALGRAALGDPSGSRLTMRPDVPRPLARWLQFAPGKRAQPEYEAWGKCLGESFGPRRFQALSITSSDIYGG